MSILLTKASSFFRKFRTNLEAFMKSGFGDLPTHHSLPAMLLAQLCKLSLVNKPETLNGKPQHSNRGYEHYGNSQGKRSVLESFFNLITGYELSLRKIPQSHLILWFGNCAFPQNFHTRRLGEIAVYEIVARIHCETFLSDSFVKHSSMHISLHLI